MNVEQISGFAAVIIGCITYCVGKFIKLEEGQIVARVCTMVGLVFLVFSIFMNDCGNSKSALFLGMLLIFIGFCGSIKS